MVVDARLWAPRGPHTHACASMEFGTAGRLNTGASQPRVHHGGILAELNPCDWQPPGPQAEERYRNFPTERGVAVARIHIQEAPMAKKREDA
jgi:hypothetical protein